MVQNQGGGLLNMKRETIKTITEGITQASERYAFDVLRHVLATTIAVSGASDGEILKIFRASAKVRLLERLAKVPEPEPAKVAALLDLLKDPSVMRRALIEYARKQPHGPGGRPRAKAVATPEGRAELCARIEKLLPDCLDPQHAFRQAAAGCRPPVSVSTARRVWREHISRKKELMQGSDANGKSTRK
jgi:hypothetical protein